METNTNNSVPVVIGALSLACQEVGWKLHQQETKETSE